MRIQSEQTKALISTSIIREDERFVTVSLSTKETVEQSAYAQALRLVYGEILTSGSGKLSREAFHDALSKLGSEIKISSSGTLTTASLRSLDTKLGATIKLFEAMIKAPLFEATELQRIKEYLRNNLLLLKEDARSESYRNFVASLVHSDDPRYIFGVDEVILNLKKVTKQDLIKYHTSLWKSDWIVTCGGSEACCKTSLSAVEKLRKFTHSKTLTESKQLKIEQTEGKRVVLTDIPNKQNIEFSIGGSVQLTMNDHDYIPLMFGMCVLGIYGGFSGRLMSSVREKEGLTYSIYAQLEGITLHDQGFWRIMTFFASKDAVKGITSTLREVKKIAEEGITANELKRFKSILKTRYALIEDSLLKKVRESHTVRIAGLSVDEFMLLQNAIEKLSVTEVNSALKKHINVKSLIISGAGPISSVAPDIRKI